MSIAWISLAALLIAVTLSMVTKVNVGVVSLAFAWIVGVYLGGLPLNTVIGAFPISPGNIAPAALPAPMAMAIGHRANVPPFLMILMVGNGAQAGALSPFAPTGVIVNQVMARIGLG